MRTPSTSPSPRLPRLAALTHPVSSLMRFAPSRAGIRRECLEGDEYKAVLDPGQGLHLLGHRTRLRRGGLCGASGAGDSPRRARQKRGQIIAEADDPTLGSLLGAVFRLAPASRLWCGARKHHDGRFAGFAARLDRSGALAPARLPVIAAFSGRRGTRTRPLARVIARTVPVRCRAASAAAAIAALEIQLDGAESGDAGDREL